MTKPGRVRPAPQKQSHSTKTKVQINRFKFYLFSLYMNLFILDGVIDIALIWRPENSCETQDAFHHVGSRDPLRSSDLMVLHLRFTMYICAGWGCGECTGECRWSSDIRNLTPSASGLTGCCELFCMVPGNQTGVLWESSLYLYFNG